MELGGGDAIGGVAFGPGEVPARNGAGADGGVPAAAQFGQGEVGAELAAAVPDGCAGLGGVVGEGDGVAGDLAGGAGAEPGADQDPGPLKVSEAARTIGRAGYAGESAGSPAAVAASSSRLS